MKRMKQSLRLYAVCVAATLLLSGCGATIKQSETLNPRVEAARAAFGPGFDYMIIDSGGLVADTLFVGYFGNSSATSDLAHQLYNRIVEAEKKGTRFMVTGERAEKTAFVIIQALSFAPENSLPDLELLYLGDQQHVTGIEESVIRVGGEMRFAPYAG